MSALCRSRRELSNAYLLAKFGFDTAENEPSKVYPEPRARAAAAAAPAGGDFRSTGGGDRPGLRCDSRTKRYAEAQTC